MMKLRLLSPVVAGCVLASCASESVPKTPLAAATQRDEGTVQPANARRPEKPARLSTLERAVLELPSAALADIPFSERRIFLDHLGKDKRADGTPSGERLDLEHHYLHFYSDGEVPFRATSMLYVKVFKGRDGAELVFCHMPKPQADSRPPRAGQTFLFARRDRQWIDVTAELLPKESDRLRCFRPRRTADVIEAGDYRQTIVRPGGGHDYKREVDFHWNGSRFMPRPAPSQEFS